MQSARTTSELSELVECFVAVWNEPDAAKRRELLVLLWQPNGVHVSRGRRATGYQEIEARIIATYERVARDAGCRFVAEAPAQQVGSIVELNWRLVAPGGETAAVGLDVLQLGSDSRIERATQFIEEPGPGLSGQAPIVRL
jgi:hypothetical protein